MNQNIPLNSHVKTTCRSCQAGLVMLDRSSTSVWFGAHADAHTHCARRRDRHEKAWNIAQHTYEYISVWCAEDRRDKTSKPSVVTPYLRWTELMEPYRRQSWVVSIPKLFLKVHMRKSGVELCCRAFYLSTQQCHVSPSTHMFKNETANRHSDCMIKSEEIRAVMWRSEHILLWGKNWLLHWFVIIWVPILTRHADVTIVVESTSGRRDKLELPSEETAWTIETCRPFCLKNWDNSIEVIS